MKTHTIKSCTLNDLFYPSQLRSIKKPPKILYYLGDIGIINQRRNIAVIGSRRAAPSSFQLSYNAGKLAAQAELNLINGLALGCDAEAMKGALAEDGHCIAIMPCGLDQIQPKSNEYLAEMILNKGGCILSEYAEGTPVKKYQYVERDRLQSGVSHGVIIIEAQQNSGTMHTADFAIRQHRRLACYASCLAQNASGNLYLEKQQHVKTLSNDLNIIDFFQEIKDENSYEQLKLPF